MATIRGTVTSSDDGPVAEASIFIAAGPPHPEIIALTGDDGGYQLGDLAAGVYTLRVEAAGFAGVSGRVPVRAGRTTRVDVALQPEQVSEIGDDSDPPAGPRRTRPAYVAPEPAPVRRRRNGNLSSYQSDRG